MTLKVGICGFGKMGQIRADSINDLDRDAEVVKVFDVSYPEDCPYQKAESAHAIADDPNLDILFVCMPNFLNKEITIRALKNSKHVFCEKPPAFNAQDVRDIMEVEKECGKVLMYGFNHRQHAAIVKMKSLIDTGDHGRVIWMRGRYGKSVDADYLKTWRADPKLAGGGILLDQGIHMLDLMLHISGKPFDEVHALVSSLYWDTPGIEDNVFAIMRNNETGLSASIHSTMTQWRHLFSLEVFLERGYMVINGLKTSSNSYGEEILTVAKNRSKAPAAHWEDEERFSYKTDTSWDAEAEIFFNSVIDGKPVSCGTSQQALDVMSLIGQIYESETHKVDQLHADLQSNT